MQAPAVRQAVIDAITDTLIGTRARYSDVLAIHRHPIEPESVSSRTWMVTLSAPPAKSELDSCDLFEITYQCVGFYPAGPDSEDRVASDLERLYTPMWRLHEDHADMQSSDPATPTMDAVNGMLVARFDLRIMYRLDSSLI